MSETVNVSFVQQYKDTLVLQVQQKGSKVLQYFPIDRIQGKMMHWDRLAKGEAEELLVRHGPTPGPANFIHSRRRAILRTFHKAEYTDQADLQRLLVDPTNRYAENIRNALGRKVDDLLLNALYGSAYSVDSNDSQGTVSLSSGQIIDEDYTTANSDLTVAKLIEARRLLEVNDVDLDAEMPILIADSTALNNLLRDTQITSADYNSIRALVNGQVDTFMGFKFVRCNRLADAQHKTSEGFVRAIATVPSALGVAMGRDISVDIDKRTDLSNSIQVYAKFDLGAVRIEEEKVVVIECYRT